jgi:hypothetical protein
MNITQHAVTPETVMALLDGELSAADAQTVSAHVDHCAECAQLAERLRSTSQSLSGWSVPIIPTKLEESIVGLVSKPGSAHKIGKASLFVRASFWTWRQWAIMTGGAMVALLLVLTVSLPILRPIREMVGYPDREQLETSGGKLQVDGHAIAGQPPKVSGRQAPTHDALAPPNSPGVAGPSNGLFHGLGDHEKNSFSLDGQPISDQQSKLFSQPTPGPMIARMVSLSIAVKDFDASRTSLDTILARHHGYSAQLSVSTPENAERGLQASLRVPAPELSAAVADLKTLGRVENESQSGEEVTYQHADLVARLKNGRGTEERLRAILQQRTGKVGEVLQVEQEIARVRGDIERMEAEQKALEHRVDFATIDLQLTEEYKAQLNPPAPAVSTRIHNALVAGYRNVSESILGTILFLAEYGPTLLIVLLVIAMPGVIVWRRYRRALATI